MAAGAGIHLLTVCVDVSKFIMPHLLLVYSIDWLQKKQRKANPPAGMLNQLPDEIIVDILMRLPLKSLCCLRCVSKTCMDMVDSPIFTKLHRERLLKFSSNVHDYSAPPEVPQLVQLQCDFRCIKWHQLELNLNKGRLTKTPLPAFSMKYMMDTVDFVFCNLFFFKRSEFEFEFAKSMVEAIFPKGMVEAIFPISYVQKSHYLVDLLRGEFLQIPDCPAKNIYLVEWFGMGFDNTTNTYKIVCVLELEGMHATTAHIYELGTRSSSWREIQSVPAGGLSEKNVCAYGDMHWLVKNGSHANVAAGEQGSRIISFDFKTEEFSWTPHPTLEGLYQDCHLLNMKGSMAMVDTRGKYIQILVMKSYHKKEWALDYRINKKTLAEYPLRGFQFFFCYQWEHGIALHDGRMCYFLDLRYKSLKRLEAKSGGFMNIYSFTASLVSLKNL